MPKVHPTDAKKAIMTVATWFVGLCETLEGMEQGQHPLAAAKIAIKKAKKRQKKAKVGKKLRKKEKEVIDVKAE